MLSNDQHSLEIKSLSEESNKSLEAVEKQRPNEFVQVRNIDIRSAKKHLPVRSLSVIDLYQKDKLIENPVNNMVQSTLSEACIGEKNYF